MPTLYHGTSAEFASAMIGSQEQGRIDVLNRGGGEFGRGFYTQNSISSAHALAHVRFRNGAVLALSIADREYHQLSLKRLTSKQAKRLDRKLRARNTHQSYVTRHDAIIGPLASDPRVEQQKFQTQHAQDLLNGEQCLRTLRIW